MLRRFHSGFLLLFAAVLLAACQTAPAVSTPTATATTSAPIVTPTSTPTLAPAVSIATPTTEALGSISGWVWHDACAVSGQPIGMGKETAGCVQDGDHYRANGIKENTESIIGGVKVKLGAGACPAIGLAEADTRVTDLSYSFTGLEPGTYCVSIDPLNEPSLSKLQNGSWTYPTVTGGLIGMTIKVGAGENKSDVNFGWDYIDLPSTTSAACTYRAAFLGDVSIPDNTITASGSAFIKTWRLRNDGSCAWGPNQYVHSLVFFNGDRLGTPNEVPLLQTVPPGGIVDVSINMIAPQRAGTYRSEWMLMVAQGALFGVGSDGQTPLYAQIIVQPGIPDGGSCVYRATFLGDVSVPDYSPIAPNAPFDKIWRVRNDSTCAWGPGYALHTLVFMGGTQMSAATAVELPDVVQPGQTTDLVVSLVSPSQPGTYHAGWKLKADTGELVGVGQGGQAMLYVHIVVPDNAPCTYRATFLGDVTIPDNTQIAPGQVFRKTWRLRNDGTCAWGPNAPVYSITNVNNNPFGAPVLLDMPSVLPGGVVDLSIDMVAPNTPGVQRSEWMFMVNEGGLRGVGAQGETPLYAQINVVGVP
ncbi:MAG TPA: NBR1-Ig-like domain-containing protein [Anaerolineae bacterium]|nr:NBR1-Ig-like domain-containing protein [Anaerolineae bacterium]